MQFRVMSCSVHMSSFVVVDTTPLNCTLATVGDNFYHTSLQYPPIHVYLLMHTMQTAFCREVASRVFALRGPNMSNLVQGNISKQKLSYRRETARQLHMSF